MPFGLTIGTERAAALQHSIQDELTKRGYSPDADPVMAEYITIMVINNKTAAQITSELEDLIGSDFDPTFTEWLFLEAAKGATELLDEPPQPGPSKSENPTQVAAPPDIPPHITGDSSSRQSIPPRNGVYQQALSQALPSSSGHKRLASARSPSPSHPNKSRRTDVPTGPRAMLRDGPSSASNPHANTRSLLDRVGGPAGGLRNGGNSPNGFAHDDIQNRIDNIVNSSPDMMMANGYPGMDMNAMAGLANPLVLQEMMMNQMALMAQMASSMGMMNGGAFPGPGFPMQGMQGDLGMYQGGMNNGFQGPQQLSGSGMNIGGRGRSGTRGGRGGSTRGRGGSTSISSTPKTEATAPVPASDSTAPQPLPIAAPVPAPPNTETLVSTPINIAPAKRLAYAAPERPQSPTLCKFNTKCSNPHCRYAHPSPVATAESGVVLSNEACDKGKGCQDKDCIKGHVSPAVLNPQLVEQATPPSVSPPAPSGVPCRFGAACTRPGCTFTHPTRSITQCRFGAGCTRATCTFQHPEGRVLPTTFHRGLSTTGPMVTVATPETGTMGSAASPHRSVKFNKSSGLGLGVKEKMQQQLKEIEERKKEAERAVREAEAAAAGVSNGKKDVAKPVTIAA